jgi:hypothetical protein
MDAAELTSGLVGRDVLDAAGHLLGRLDSLFRDLDDPAVTFAAVAMIRRGRRRLVFVPLVDATVRRASVTLRCGAELARRAPQIRPGRSLPADLEGDLYRHYDIPYHARENATGRLRPVT